MTDKENDDKTIDTASGDQAPDPSVGEATGDVATPLDEVIELLEKADLSESSEPNEAALSKEEQEVESLVKEEPLDLLEDPGLIMELGEDPVRLYLKEIGGIDLLDTDQEFWLAT